jgi:prepilin-type N-terminal cleavage/methylation domain-containing protein
MRRADGFTLMEVLVASMIVGIIGVAFASFYLAMVNSFSWASSETVLQRQGGLALETIARQARRASTIATGCAPAGSLGDSLQLTVVAPLSGAGTYCYYAGTGTNGATTGALCERFTPAAGGASACRDLLGEGQGALARKTLQSSLTVIRQSSPANPACPRRSVAGQPAGVALAVNDYCLILTTPASAPGIEVAFAISDGLAIRTFAATVNRRN